MTVEEKGCLSDKTSVDLTVFPKPTINVSPDPMEACLNDTITFKNGTTPDSLTTWEWNFGDNNTSNEKEPDYKYNSPGKYKVDLTAITSNGCIDSLTNLPITIHPKPKAIIDTNWINYSNNKLEYNDNSNPGNSTSNISDWMWDFSHNVNPSNSYNPSEVVVYNDQGKYTTSLIVVNNHGCMDTTIMNIIIYKLKIPNVITPNNDGFNDKFKIKAIEDDILENVHLIIYNRWGKKIYENLNYQNNWDGENFSDGTYYYVISFISPRGEEKFNGTITILRG